MTQRRHRNRKWTIWGVVLVALIIVGVAMFVIWNNNHQKAEQEDKIEIAEMEEERSTEKHDEETEEEYSERVAEQKRIKQYEGEDPNITEELTGAITYAEVNNGVLTIGMNIDQFLSEGSCTLSLSRSGDVIYSANANILAEVSTSTCDGFSVSASGLGDGLTEIIIKLSAGGKTGIIRGEVNL